MIPECGKPGILDRRLCSCNWEPFQVAEWHVYCHAALRLILELSIADPRGPSTLHKLILPLKQSRCLDLGSR